MCYLQDPLIWSRLLIGLGVPTPLLFVNPGQPWYRWNRHLTLSKNIIFAVTCTTKEIKIQMKSMTGLVIYCSRFVCLFVCLSDPAISRRSLKTKR